MIIEIIVWAAIYVLQDQVDAWTAAIVCGALCILLLRTAPAPQSWTWRQTLLRWAQLSSVLHGLLLTAALVIVQSTYIILAGQWWAVLISLAALLALIRWGQTHDARRPSSTLLASLKWVLHPEAVCVGFT